MIVALTSEQAWKEKLGSLAFWQPPAVHTLVVAPHPDDETLGAGGLIARLRSLEIPVTIAAVTDGEHAYEDVPALSEVREREQTQALAVLGVEPAGIHRFRLKDSGVAAQEQALIELLLPLASSNTHILAPWEGDFHPDHEACGRAAREVAHRTGAQLTFYLFWTWHRGTPEIFDGQNAVAFALTPHELDSKLAALGKHRSQLEHPSGEPILPRNLLAPAKRSFEVFLPA